MNSPLLVLPMWQPWATLVVAPDPQKFPLAAPKTYETRSWAPRGPFPFSVAIHATKTWNAQLRETVARWPFDEALRRCGYFPGDPRPFLKRGILAPGGLKPLPLGAIVGVVDVHGSVTSEAWLAHAAKFEDGAAESWAEQFQFGNYEPGRHAWRLANPRALSRPVPHSGLQSALYDLDEASKKLVIDQLAVAA